MTLRLPSDQRGAIMLLGLFMAVFLTATLYYVIGIGDAIWQRERMQDAADAAAFSAAVTHARGMNVIALTNMVMAALLAVLVALKLIQTIADIAIFAIVAESFLLPGASLAEAIPGLIDLRETARQSHTALQPAINSAIETLHVAARGVRAVIPAASELMVIALVPNYFQPEARFGFAVPARITLPTEDGDFSELCDKATDYVGDAVHFVLDASRVVPGLVEDVVDGAVRDLASAGATWFCGDGSVKPPSTTVRKAIHYPTLPSRQLCMDYDPTPSASSKERHTMLCAQAESDETASRPDAEGNCVKWCGKDGLFEQRDTLARAACAPRKKHDKLKGFEWQERHFTRSYVFRDGAWWTQSDQQGEEATAHYTLEKGDERPCGTENAKVSKEWFLSLHPTGSKDLMPLCSDVAGPTEPGLLEGQTTTLEHTEVLHLFSCSETISRDYDVGKRGEGGRFTNQDDGSGLKKVPQRLEKGRALGDDAFQVRGVVFGGLPLATGESVIEVATWKPASDASAWRIASNLGRVSVAQAEYFYAGKSKNRGDFLWSMSWSARLRRFRLPEHTAGATAASGETEQPAPLPFAGSFEDACAASAADSHSGIDAEKGASSCSTLDLSISDLFVH